MRLVADDALEVAHDQRVRVRSDCGADDVERVVDALDPVAERGGDGVGERAVPSSTGHDLGAEQAHLVDVERLPADVLDTHEDGALHAHERRGRRGGDSVLTRAGLGDHALLAHALGEQALAERVVDLVRTGVVEILALQVDRAEARPPRRVCSRDTAASDDRRSRRATLTAPRQMRCRLSLRRRRRPIPRARE